MTQWCRERWPRPDRRELRFSSKRREWQAPATACGRDAIASHTLDRRASDGVDILPSPTQEVRDRYPPGKHERLEFQNRLPQRSPLVGSVLTVVPAAQESARVLDRYECRITSHSKDPPRGRAE